MKFNFTQLSLGSFAALALLAVPLAMTQSAHAEGGRRGQHFEQLNLTDAQSAQMDAIRDGARSQMASVLTDAQRATLEGLDHQGRRAWRELDLSEDQRTQLRSIRDASREQIGTVLTAEQREQLAQMHDERHERRGNRGERSGDRTNRSSNAQ